MEKAIFVIIDESCPPNVTFVEIEREGGRSIKIGERIALPDFLTAIKITSTDIDNVYSNLFYRCKCGEEIEGNESTNEHQIICPKCKRKGQVELQPF